MKNSERIEVLERAVSETAIEFRKFVEHDAKWSDKISEAIVGLIEHNKKIREELQVTRAVMVCIGKEAGLSEKQLHDAVNEGLTVSELADKVPDGIENMPRGDAEKIVREILAQVMRGGASEH